MSYTTVKKQSKHPDDYDVTNSGGLVISAFRGCTPVQKLGGKYTESPRQLNLGTYTPPAEEEVEEEISLETLSFGFEDVNHGWTLGTGVTLSTTRAYEGSQSVRVDKYGANNGYRTLAKTVTVASDSVMTFRYYRDAGLYGLDSVFVNGSSVLSIHDNSDLRNWDAKTLNLPEGECAIEFRFSWDADNNGYVYIDDIDITNIAP